MKYIAGIDPGNESSAFALIDIETLRPIAAYKGKNENTVENLLNEANAEDIISAPIERMQSYGMGVGQSVFDTCIWTGRFIERLNAKGIDTPLIPRREVKLYHCGMASAKDANVIAALKERFGDKGTKKNQGGFTE